MDIEEVLTTCRDDLIKEWITMIRTISERYSHRQHEELQGTITEATDANFRFMTRDDPSKMDSFIRKITVMRIEVGFSLSEVQSAFELYRTIMVPIFLRELDSKNLLQGIQKLNSCLAYTIHKFSEEFESIHQKTIRDHAENLERIVEARTAELAESESKYRTLVEDINDGYFVSRKRRVIFANRAFCDMHGYTLDEVIGSPYMIYVAPESRDNMAKMYQERTATGQAPDQYVYVGLHKDGSKFYLENKVKSIIYEGEPATAGISRDITERVELERHKLKLVELENERKTIALTILRQLMVTLSHYLLNANTVIGGMARRSMRAVSDEERSAALETIRKQTAKTEGIISALKRISEIRTSEYVSESKILMVDIAKEIEESLAAAEKKKVTK